MLHEAYYPSEGGDNGPIKILYGFVQEGVGKDHQLTLVVFYPKLTGTSLFNLSIFLIIFGVYFSITQLI